MSEWYGGINEGLNNSVLIEDTVILFREEGNVYLRQELDGKKEGNERREREGEKERERDRGGRERERERKERSGNLERGI